MCANSVVWVHTVCLYAKIRLKSLQEYSADDINRRHFQLHVFLAFLGLNSFRAFCLILYDQTFNTSTCVLIFEILFFFIIIQCEISKYHGLDIVRLLFYIYLISKSSHLSSCIRVMKFTTLSTTYTAAYLHTRNTVLWKENRKETFRRWLRRINLGSVEGGCLLK